MQTKIGAAKAVQTIKDRHGEDFFKNIGASGGSAPTTKPKGFAANRERAVAAGKIGGTISRRKK